MTLGINYVKHFSILHSLIVSLDTADVVARFPLHVRMPSNNLVHLTFRGIHASLEADEHNVERFLARGELPHADIGDVEQIW